MRLGLLALMLLLAGCASRVAADAPWPRGAVADLPNVDCAAGFSLDGLREKAFAFAGTVESIPYTRTAWQHAQIRLRVDEWFRGGSATSVTVLMPAPQAHRGYVVGTRLLVAGESRYAAAGCGFIRYWTAADAAKWRAATARSRR